MLALRGLLRLRNLVHIAVPALAMTAVALAFEGRVAPAHAAGALVVASVPAPLVAFGVVARLRGRADLAGGLVVGTIALSAVLIALRGQLAAGGLIGAVQVFLVAAMVGSAIPPIRDALLLPLRILGWAALIVVFVLALLMVERIDLEGALVAGALLLAGTAASGLTALVFGRDPLGVIAGAGLRDPVLALALAATASGSTLVVPLVYSAGCVALAAATFARRR